MGGERALADRDEDGRVVAIDEQEPVARRAARGVGQGIDPPEAGGALGGVADRARGGAAAIEELAVLDDQRLDVVRGGRGGRAGPARAEGADAAGEEEERQGAGHGANQDARPAAP